MPITDFLIHNSQQYPDKVCLVEINPEQKETRKRSYKDYELIPATPSPYFRREITWQVFNEKANRFAHLLLSRGISYYMLVILSGIITIITHITVKPAPNDNKS